MSKLTKRVVDAAKPRDKEFILWDADIAGFGLRVRPTGRKSYILKYRVGGGRSTPVRKPTIGVHGSITADEARSIAKRWAGLIANGKDPGGDRYAQRSAPIINQLATDYLERHAKKKRSGSEDARRLKRRILPKIGQLKVRDVGRRHIEDIHRSLEDTPYEANRTLALLSTIFGIASEWGWCDFNPCKGIERYHEEPRERFLSPDEVHRLSKALNSVTNQQSADAIRLLLLTGARRGEVLAATWEQFDLERGIWLKPSAHTKQKKQHRVPLSPPAIQLLQRINQDSASKYVFPNFENNGAIQGIKRTWASARQIAGLEDCRLHDLRHTFASTLIASGFSLPVIGALLGHTQPQTTTRYAHLADHPLRAATDHIGAIFEADNYAEAPQPINIRTDKKYVL